MIKSKLQKVIALYSNDQGRTRVKEAFENLFEKLVESGSTIEAQVAVSESLRHKVFVASCAAVFVAPLCANILPNLFSSATVQTAVYPALLNVIAAGTILLSYLRIGRLNIHATALCVLTIACFSFTLFLTGGIASPLGIFTPTILVLVGFLCQARGTLIAATYLAALQGTLYTLDHFGLLPSVYVSSPAWLPTCAMVVATVLSGLVIYLFQKARGASDLALLMALENLRLKEQVARKSEAELKIIFDNAPVSIARIDQNLCFAEVNPAFCQFIGYSAQELQGKAMVDFTCIEDHGKNMGIEPPQIQGDDWVTEGFENRFIHKSGKVIWGLVTSKAIDIEQGKHRVFLSSVQDITIRKEQDALLRANQVFTDNVLKLSPSAVMTLDLRSKHFSYVSDAIGTLLGYTKEEFFSLGSHFASMIFDPSQLQIAPSSPDAVAPTKSERLMSDEINLKHKDGHWITVVRKTTVFMLDETGNPTHLLATVTDISKEIELRDQTAEALRLFEEAQKVAKIASWTHEFSTNKSHWSKQMFEFFNLEPSQYPPDYETKAAFIHPEDRPIWDDIGPRCLRDPTPFTVRYRTAAKGMDCIWLETRAAQELNAAGEIVRIRGTTQDVTDLVRAEEGAKQDRAKALQAAKLASLGEMSAGIAHEINNPLAIVLGTARTLIKFANDPVLLKARVDTIQKSAERIAKIVRSLKKFSRSGDSEDRSDHSLREIVNESVILTNAKSIRHSTPVIFDCNSTATIRCSDIEIEQVLVNLINNAIDAVKELTGVDAKWVKISVFDEGKDVVLQVRDSGRGVPEKMRGRLFEPFATSKPVGQGTGLGLSISKGIVEDHHGKIELLTGDEHTCFEIRFPIVGEQHQMNLVRII